MCASKFIENERGLRKVANRVRESPARCRPAEIMECRPAPARYMTPDQTALGTTAPFSVGNLLNLAIAETKEVMSDLVVQERVVVQVGTVSRPGQVSNRIDRRPAPLVPFRLAQHQPPTAQGDAHDVTPIRRAPRLNSYCTASSPVSVGKGMQLARLVQSPLPHEESARERRHLNRSDSRDMSDPASEHARITAHCPVRKIYSCADFVAN